MIVLDYVVPLDTIDSYLPAHNEWLDECYRNGVFLASGRREPRVGGVILTVDVARDVVDDAVARDPFRVHGIATHTVIEFHPNRVADVLGPAAGTFA